MWRPPNPETPIDTCTRQTIPLCKHTMKTYTVVSCNPSNEGKTHVTKMFCLQEEIEHVFGKGVRETLYNSGKNRFIVGTKISLDTAEWDVREYPFETENGTFLCKWLHLKAGVIPKVKVEPPLE